MVVTVRMMSETEMPDEWVQAGLLVIRLQAKVICHSAEQYRRRVGGEQESQPPRCQDIFFCEYK